MRNYSTAAIVILLLFSPLLAEEEKDFFTPGAGLGLGVHIASAKFPSGYSPPFKLLLSPKYHLEIGRLNYGRSSYQLRGIYFSHKLKNINYGRSDSLYNKTNYFSIVVYGAENQMSFAFTPAFFGRIGLGLGSFSSKAKFGPASYKKSGIYSEINLGLDNKVQEKSIGNFKFPIMVGVSFNYRFLKTSKFGQFIPLTSHNDYLSYVDFGGPGLGVVVNFGMVRRGVKQEVKIKPAAVKTEQPPANPVVKMPPKKEAPPKKKTKPAKEKKKADERIKRFMGARDNVNQYGVIEPSPKGIECLDTYLGKGKFKGNPILGFKLAKKIAGSFSMKKDPIGLYVMGMSYFYGEGTIKDLPKALKYFKKAADKDNIFAFYMIGLMIESGHATQKDHFKALDWFVKAAEAGHVPSQFTAGQIYMTGKGVEKNLGKALQFYHSAAEQGLGEAQFQLGVMYQGGLGVEKDVTNAAAWYQMAALQGEVESIYNLGLLYEKGEGVPTDIARAIGYYEKAAQAGHERSRMRLGDMYYYAQGVEKDFPIALMWYKQAAQTGNARAEFTVGLMYEKGEGDDMNLETALKWYNRASDHNHEGAKTNLKRLLKEHEERLDKKLFNNLDGTPPNQSENAQPNTEQGMQNENKLSDPSQNPQ